MKQLNVALLDPVWRVLRWAIYAVWLLKEVIVNAYYMAFDVNHAKSKISPAILRFPIRHMTSAEVIVLATSITLTPGSLVLAIDRGEATPSSPLDGVSSPGDNGYLLVHVVYAEDLEQERTVITDMRRHVMCASRGWQWQESDE